MINTCHKRHQKKGFSTLLMTLVVLLSVTLFAFISATLISSQQKEVSNEFRIQQSFNASQAGLNYGIAYLGSNYESITNNQVVTGALSDGSTYSVTFIFKAGKDFIEVASVGTSSDGEVKSGSKEWVKYVSGTTVAAPPIPLIVRGSVNLNGNTSIENFEGSSTIMAGGTVDINGSGATFLSEGVVSSDASNMNSDVVLGDGSLSSLGNEDLVSEYLGQTITGMKSAASATYTQSSNYNYSSELSGVEGGTVVINQLGGEAVVNGSGVAIGTEANPVTIIIDGNLKLQGQSSDSGVTINGNVIVTGDMNLAGNVTINGLVMVLGNNGLKMGGNTLINGSVISGGDATTESVFTGSSKIHYNSDVLQSTLSVLPSSDGTYSRIAGSWFSNGTSP